MITLTRIQGESDRLINLSEGEEIKLNMGFLIVLISVKGENCKY